MAWFGRGLPQPGMRFFVDHPKYMEKKLNQVALPARLTARDPLRNFGSAVSVPGQWQAATRKFPSRDRTIHEWSNSTPEVLKLFAKIGLALLACVLITGCGGMKLVADYDEKTEQQVNVLSDSILSCRSHLKGGLLTA